MITTVSSLHHQVRMDWCGSSVPKTSEYSFSLPLIKRNSDTMNSLNKMENSVRVSLKNLGVSNLDLYLMHWPESSAFGDATDPRTKSGSEYRQFLNWFKTTWKAMEGLVELVLVRAIGVSHFNIEQIKELLSEFL
ncbi:Aldo-keto reductase family 1 member A1-A [Camellia lanceoleosa]|uniref:Aldo-keto reductase family 1 member A1-A n=1 Tax=Camellia lanceoleosa TaxID=1840588 RepID=A0ACC0IL87_9ERIC|nr:Aldo-keto reductase family 1 member A1-A [Camellia lanceoleosa]